jgi:hypothetical protein
MDAWQLSFPFVRVGVEELVLVRGIVTAVFRRFSCSTCALERSLLKFDPFFWSLAVASKISQTERCVWELFMFYRLIFCANCGEFLWNFGGFQIFWAIFESLHLDLAPSPPMLRCCALQNK